MERKQVMKDLKIKISEILKMFEIIYSKRNDLNVSLIRLWSLKKMKDRIKGYLPLFDLPNSEKYVTKAIIRDVDYVYDVYTTILNQK